MDLHLKLFPFIRLCESFPQREPPLPCVLSVNPQKHFWPRQRTNGSTGVPGGAPTRAFPRMRRQCGPEASAPHTTEVWGTPGASRWNCHKTATGRFPSLHLQEDVMTIVPYRSSPEGDTGSKDLQEGPMVITHSQTGAVLANNNNVSIFTFGYLTFITLQLNI